MLASPLCSATGNILIVYFPDFTYFVRIEVRWNRKFSQRHRHVPLSKSPSDSILNSCGKGFSTFRSGGGRDSPPEASCHRQIRLQRGTPIQGKAILMSSLRQRKGRDSNPRCTQGAYWFSRPAYSTALAPFRFLYQLLERRAALI